MTILILILILRLENGDERCVVFLTDYICPKKRKKETGSREGGGKQKSGVLWVSPTKFYIQSGTRY